MTASITLAFPGTPRPYAVWLKSFGPAQCVARAATRDDADRAMFAHLDEAAYPVVEVR